MSDAECRDLVGAGGGAAVEGDGDAVEADGAAGMGEGGAVGVHAALSDEAGATGAGFAWHDIGIVGARGRKSQGKRGTERCGPSAPAGDDFVVCFEWVRGLGWLGWK